MIGRIQRVPLRQVTPHEAYNFTTWLVENIDVLNDVLGLNLVEAEREKEVGSFSVDIIAEDEKSKSIVVIENQLEKSNHDHLGKLMTYMSNLEAKVAIWIVSEPRPEHMRAIQWLNESGLAEFYLVKVEAIKVDDSVPAFWFTLIIGPTEESRVIGEVKEETAERYGLREKFWTSLLEKAKSRTNLHAGISPGQVGWIATSSGKRGLSYIYAVRKNDAQVELYLDRGNAEENKNIFEQLQKYQKEIETSFGDILSWERLDNKQACRIRKIINTGGYRNPEEEWPTIQNQMIDAMIGLEKSLKPFIAKLDI